MNEVTQLYLQICQRRAIAPNCLDLDDLQSRKTGGEGLLTGEQGRIRRRSNALFVRRGVGTQKEAAFINGVATLHYDNWWGPWSELAASQENFLTLSSHVSRALIQQRGEKVSLRQARNLGCRKPGKCEVVAHGRVERLSYNLLGLFRPRISHHCRSESWNNSCMSLRKFGGIISSYEASQRWAVVE
jgi:hypothetical protein